MIAILAPCSVILLICGGIMFVRGAREEEQLRRQATKARPSPYDES